MADTTRVLQGVLAYKYTDRKLNIVLSSLDQKVNPTTLKNFSVSLYPRPKVQRVSGPKIYIYKIEHSARYPKPNRKFPNPQEFLGVSLLLHYLNYLCILVKNYLNFVLRKNQENVHKTSYKLVQNQERNQKNQYKTRKTSTKTQQETRKNKHKTSCKLTVGFVFQDQRNS